MEENKSVFFAQNEEDIEKAHFGEGIYISAHKLPPIILTSKNIETFKNYTGLVRDISESCGKEITLLFAELYKIYGMEDEENNSVNNAIIYFCTKAIGQLSLSLKQSEKLLILMNDFENKKEEKVNIEGADYCFILILLNRLFCVYSTIYTLILEKRYFGKENLKAILERLSFILSEEFESIRRLFKTVECDAAIDSSPTFH